MQTVRVRAALPTLLLSLLIAGCGPAVTPASSALTSDQLANAEYQSPTPAQGLIRLTDGEYHEPAAPGSASELSVTMLPDMTAFGHLDADSFEDAAVILAGSAGGSGTFITLAAVLNDGGAPRHVASADLGDRVQVHSVTIDSGEIIVSLTTHAPSDPLCCPTLETVRRFRLEQDRLVEVSPPA